MASAPESLRQGILRFSPSFYFPMIEPSGSIYSAVGEHVGTVNGAPTFGVASMAARDSGGIGYVTAGTAFHSVPDHGDADLGNTFTIGCLYRRTVDSGTWGLFVHKGTGAYGFGISETDKLYLVETGVAQIVTESGTSPVEATTHMGLVTFNGANTAKLYKDGVDVSSSVHATETFGDTATALIIGAQTGGTNGAGSDVSHLFAVKGILTLADAAYLWRLALKPYSRENYSRFPKSMLRRAA